MASSYAIDDGERLLLFDPLAVPGLREGVTREQIADGMRPLLERPIEQVLAAHGGPQDRAALEHALSAG
jgi:hypothetical protein